MCKNRPKNSIISVRMRKFDPEFDNANALKNFNTSSLNLSSISFNSQNAFKGYSFNVFDFF